MPNEFDESKHPRSKDGRFSSKGFVIEKTPGGPDNDVFFGSGVTQKDGSVKVQRVPQQRYEGIGAQRGIPIKSPAPPKQFKINKI